MKKTALLILLSVCLLACEKTASQPDLIVVEGWIEEGAHPVVFLHKAVRLNEKDIKLEDMMRESIVYSARVHVADGTDSVQLIAKIDTTMLPPYYYHNVRIKGEAGGIYRLTVDYQGQTLTATTTVLPAVLIDSIVIASAEGQPDAKEVIVHFRDNPATTDCYALFYNQGGQKQYALASMGVMDDGSRQGEHIAWRLNRSNTLLDPADVFHFAAGDTVRVKLSHIDDEAYAVWSSFASSSVSNTWIFMPKAQIKTNIQGGAGCWCGFGSDIREIRIPAHDTVFIYADSL